jgi:hypothetical protein
VSLSADILCLVPTTRDLWAALENALAIHLGTLAGIRRLERRPCAYRTSFPLEELDVTLDDGTSLELIFKSLSREAMSEVSRRAKPAFLHDPLREIETYRHILSPASLGTPVCYGAVSDRRAGHSWLFLERVAGLALPEVGQFGIWEQVARWLAAFHTRFTAAGGSLKELAPLLVHDGDYYRVWLRRARNFVDRGSSSRRQVGHDILERLACRYEEVIDRLRTLPVTLLHGEFYASNVLVQQTIDRLRVCPVDWEMAALGPGVLDLAALTAGKWSEAQRTTLALAYHASLVAAGVQPLPREALLAALDCARLHVALQWLGWSPDWSPPREHAQDWLAEVVTLTERLGL